MPLPQLNWRLLSSIRWESALKGEFEKDYFKKLKRSLEEEMKIYTIFPPSQGYLLLEPTDVVRLCESSYTGSGKVAQCFVGWLERAFRIHITTAGKHTVDASSLSEPFED
ncbi:hypothetical protein L218DRAFT_487309 [Marasmius fiardii PR-910]|nr:hypothetical protein L218DRAFT_487309 [Marasmius fiardii PR-910]